MKCLEIIPIVSVVPDTGASVVSFSSPPPLQHSYAFGKRITDKKNVLKKSFNLEFGIMSQKD